MSVPVGEEGGEEAAVEEGADAGGGAAAPGSSRSRASRASPASTATAGTTPPGRRPFWAAQAITVQDSAGGRAPASWYLSETEDDVRSLVQALQASGYAGSFAGAGSGLDGSTLRHHQHHYHHAETAGDEADEEDQDEDEDDGEEMGGGVPGSQVWWLTGSPPPATGPVSSPRGGLAYPGTYAFPQAAPGAFSPY